MSSAPRVFEERWPAPRSCHALAFLPGEKAVAVWGGARACGRDVVDDEALWLWSGKEWRRMPGPPVKPREDALVAWDTRRGALVVYGGRRDAEVFEDTWEWTAQDGWSTKATGSGPGKLEHAACAFDERRGRFVVFGGGSRTGQMSNATWEWDGASWERVAASGPSARVGHSLLWSPRDERLLLYGGFDASESFRDLWSFDGAEWKRLDERGPTISEGPALGWLGDAPVVIGPGAGDAPALHLRAWCWRDAAWHALGAAGPPTRTGQALASDVARGRLVLFGGADERGAPARDVWEFDASVWVRRSPGE